jgi:hypothetical protein
MRILSNLADATNSAEVLVVSQSQIIFAPCSFISQAKAIIFVNAVA